MKLFQEKKCIFQFLLTKICWRHGGIISGSFEACLNNFLSIPVCEALQFSPSSARMLTRLIPALKWNGAIQKIRYIASSPHKRYCCIVFLISRNRSSRIQEINTKSTARLLGAHIQLVVNYLIISRDIALVQVITALFLVCS